MHPLINKKKGSYSKSKVKIKYHAESGSKLDLFLPVVLLL